MSVLTIIGDPGDGSLYTNGHLDEGGTAGSNPNFQDDARAGAGAALLDDPLGAQVLTIGGGLWNNGRTTDRKESFIAFRPAQGLGVPTGQGEVELVNAAIRHGSAGRVHNGTPTDDSIRWYIRNWTNPLSSSAWVDTNGLQGGDIPEFETRQFIKANNDSALYEVSARRMYADALAKLISGGDLTYMLIMSSAVFDYDTSLKERGFTMFLPSANTILKPSQYKPAAVLRFVRRHALNHVLGASIQMTDGTAVFLRYDDSIQRVSLYYQKVNQTTPTLIAHLKSKTPSNNHSGGASTYFGIEPGNQTFAITRDDSNNIYVVGSRGNEQSNEFNTQFYNTQCFKYNGNFTWTEYAQGFSGESTAIPSDDAHRGQPNCFAAVWLPTSQAGALGQICSMHSRRDGQWSRYQMGICSEYAGSIQGVTGAVRQHGIGFAGGTASDVSTWWRPWNSAGGGMDAFRDGNKVRFASFLQATATSPDERSASGWADVPASGAVPTLLWANASVSTQSPHDPDAKIRAVWLGDNSPQYGIARHGHILLLNKSDETVYRQIDLSASGITGFPSRTDLQRSAAWDCIWVNGQTRIAIYYKDTNNARKIRRVFWDFATGNVSPSEDFTPVAVGDSGSDIIAIRLPRQQTDVRCILLDVAMQDGAGAIAGLVTLRDTSLDLPPNPPTINAIDQFNAAGTKAIEWVFNDNNPADFATFQDVEIRNLSTGVTAHFVNHVTAVVVNAAQKLYRYTIGSSVLTNDTQYQIRVRSYDSVDVVGDWSTWVNFATTATGGVVHITDPATDLEPLNRSSRLIKWSYENTGDPLIVQAGYRVRVYNDDSGVLVSDTNVVTSTVTEYLLTGLVSDIRYRVEVIIKDSADQLSGAGTRLVFPDFNNPSVPEVSLEVDPGVIRVRVTNPPPDGDNPVTVENQVARKETGTDDDKYVVVGTCPPDGVFVDWTVASGVDYTYKARGRS